MASVAGLAPARVCLKGRARELLCIDGLLVEWPASRSPTVVVKPAFALWATARSLRSRCARRRLVPEVGIAPTSPRLQRGANLPQLLGKAENGLMDEWMVGLMGRMARGFAHLSTHPTVQ